MDDLPNDIYLDLTKFLSYKSINSLYRTNKKLKLICDTSILPNYLFLNRRKSYIDDNHTQSVYRKFIRFNTIDNNWNRVLYSSNNLATTPTSIPVLCVHDHYVLLGSRSCLYIWNKLSSPLKYIKFTISNNLNANFDITGIVVISTINDVMTVVVSHANGLVHKLNLNLSSSKYLETALYDVGARSLLTKVRSVRSLIGNRHYCISAKDAGFLSLFKPQSPWEDPTTVNVETNRLWSLDLNYVESKIYTANNYSRNLQSSIQSYKLSESSIINVDSLNTPQEVSSFAVINGTQTNGILSSPSIVIGGFYDSTVRIYDTRVGKDDMICFHDNLDPQPVYSLDVGGGYDSQIIVGSALYSRLRIIDARLPINTPSNHIFAAQASEPSSPVYQVKVDHKNLYLATGTRLYSFNFDHNRYDRRSSFPCVTS